MYRPPFGSRGNFPFPPGVLNGGPLETARLGSGGGLLGGAQALLAEINLPQQHARTWAVLLKALRFASGTLVVGPPPDTQIDQGLCKVRLEWGVAGAMEEASVDYPWAGGTFSIHAATVRVYGPLDVVRQNNVQTQFAAFITPGANRDNSNMNPSFTTGTLPITGPGGQATFDIPPRARTYLPFITDVLQTGDATGAKVDQIWQGNGNIVKNDAANLSSVSVGGSNQPGALPGYPLHPRATGIQLTANVTVATRNWGIIFFLDLG